MKIRRLMLMLLCAVATVLVVLLLSRQNYRSSETVESFRREAMVSFEPRLNAAKQKEFERFHPMGIATKVRIEDVEFRWKGGKPTFKLGDVEQVETTFTLYWTSALRKNGWSRIREVFDMRSKKLVIVRLLETNGITNSQLLQCSN